MHVAQSGWQGEQIPPVVGELDVVVLLDVTAVAREKVDAGQEAVHLPFKANWPFWEHVRQNVDEPAHVAHDESHAITRG